METQPRRTAFLRDTGRHSSTSESHGLCGPLFISYSRAPYEVPGVESDPQQPAGHANPCPATAREVLTGSLSQAFSNFGGLLLTPGVPGLGAASHPPVCTSISSVLRLSPSVPCKDTVIVLGAACSGATVVSRFCLQRSCLPTRSPSQVPETGLQRISCTDTPRPPAVCLLTRSPLGGPRLRTRSHPRHVRFGGQTRFVPSRKRERFHAVLGSRIPDTPAGPRSCSENPQ